MSKRKTNKLNFDSNYMIKLHKSSIRNVQKNIIIKNKKIKKHPHNFEHGQ